MCSLRIGTQPTDFRYNKHYLNFILFCPIFWHYAKSILPIVSWFIDIFQVILFPLVIHLILLKLHTHLPLIIFLALLYFRAFYLC